MKLRDFLPGSPLLCDPAGKRFGGGVFFGFLPILRRYFLLPILTFTSMNTSGLIAPVRQ